MTLNALDAVIGAVYLTPKGRQLLRIDNAPDTPADSVRFRRLDEPRMGEEINVLGSYALSPAPVEAAPVVPSRVAKLLGAPIDTIVAAVEAREEPYTSSPLTDADIEELMTVDSRPRVMRALRAEHARRVDAATVRAPLHTEAPAIVVDAPAVPVPDPVLWWWHDESECYVELTRAEHAASPDSGILVEVGDDDAKAADIAARAAREQAAAKSPPPGKGEWRDGVLVPEDDVEAVSSSAPDDLPWPASTSSDPLAAPIVDAPAAEQTDAPISTVEPETTISAAPVSDAISPDGGDGSGDDAATSSAAPAPTEPAKPEKVRPRGWCPACRQFLTVRADGTMMQHYTPDGAKGPDGKRIDCQGVGLTPAAERPPEPRLPLPVAMKVDPPVAPVVERPALVSPSSDPVIAARVEESADTLSDADFDAMDAIREHDADADAPPVAVRVPAPPVLHRYTVGGGSPYGWIIFDLLLGAAMEREDGTLARWEHEADARAALVYVHEHGELPGDVVEEPAPAPLDSTSTCDHTAGYVDGRCAACDADEPGEVGRLARQVVRTMALVDRLANDNLELRNRPNAAIAIPQRPRGNPIDELSRIVEEAKTRGVRVRIVIEPIE